MISLLCTSIVIRATMILRTIAGISPLTIIVRSFNWFIMIVRWFSIDSPVLAFYLIASYEFRVQIIWEATATTWLGWAMIHSSFFLYLPSIHSLKPMLMILRTESYISFWRCPSHISTPFFAWTIVLNITFYFSGLIIPSIKFVSAVVFPSTM